jgi:hypothetical protein
VLQSAVPAIKNKQACDSSLKLNAELLVPLHLHNERESSQKYQAPEPGTFVLFRYIILSCVYDWRGIRSARIALTRLISEFLFRFSCRLPMISVTSRSDQQ